MLYFYFRAQGLGIIYEVVNTQFKIMLKTVF